MNKQDEINAIEHSVKDARKTKDMGSALERLQKNRDFLAVIKAGYFEAEAIRLVHLRGDTMYQTPERQADILKQIDAISSLHQYFQVIQMLAGQADKAIEDGEAVLEEMREEGSA